MLGQHTGEVLAELGYSDHELGQLAGEGIVATRTEIEARGRG
jgi:crotonobetainyl-CoA:carnitine CoA-transferase CaiB-like acyl-CoA transferase